MSSAADGVGFFEWWAANGRPLNTGDPAPLYHQLAVQLRSWITSGPHDGMQMPTEQELSSRLSISRATIKHANTILEREHLVSREQGRGTFVRSGRLIRPLALRSLWSDLAEAGRTIATQVLHADVTEADDDVASALGMAAGNPVIALVRLRRADGEPFALLRNWLPHDTCAAILHADLEGGSLYQELADRCGVVPRRAEQVIGARKPSDHERECLELGDDEDVLYVTRHAFDETGRPVEWGKHAYPASSSQFTITLDTSADPGPETGR